MTASDGNADGNARRFHGFEAYADDTPRGAGPADVYADDPWPEPDEPTAGYGLSDDAPPPRRARWIVPGAVAAIGVALATGAGIYLGRDQKEPPPEAATPAVAAPAEPQMNVQVASVAETLPPPPPASAAPKLEVLPRSAEGSVAPPIVTRPAPPPRIALPTARAPAVPGPAPASAPAPPPPREFAVGPTARDAVAVAPPPRESFDCGDAPTLATAMVCRDRGLANLDQRMKRAYVAALDAGAPSDFLRADQDDWLAVREEAAQISPQAVADIYRQRIGELRRAAQSN